MEMKNINKILSLLVGLVFFAQPVLPAKKITIRIHFFQGTWMEGQPGLNKVTVLMTSSDPTLAELKTIVDKSKNEQKIAVTEALLDILNLRSIEDLFSKTLIWEGIGPGLSDTVVRKSLAFRFIFVPKRISPRKIALGVALLKSKEGSLGTGEPVERQVQKAAKLVQDKTKMEQILDQVLELEIGDPVIICIPYKDQIYFMMILLKSGMPGLEEKPSKTTKSSEPTEVVEAPKPVRRILPAYPEQLRQQGVQGVTKLRVSIDQEGRVLDVKVLKSVHPYLDYAAVQALRQWEFEPVLLNKKPVSVAFMVAVNFDLRTWTNQEETTENEEVSPAGLEPSSQPLLRMILHRCAEYCQKLAGLALDFICEETIKKIHYNFGPEGGWIEYLYGSSERDLISASAPLFDTKLTEKNSFVCDYLLVKKGEKIEERRILLQQDGRRMPDRGTLLEQKKFSILRPFLAPIRLLDPDCQPLFNYTLLPGERVNKKTAYLIEAVPKSKDMAGIHCARIWVDVNTFQILQCEIEGVPIEGYEDIVEDCVRFNIKPFFTTTYFYQIERKGILFPSRVAIRVIYEAAKTRLKKMKTEITYEKYKIFTVETEQKIK